MRETVSRRLSVCAVSKLNFFYRRHKIERGKAFIVWPSNGEWRCSPAIWCSECRPNRKFIHRWKLRAKVIGCTYRNGKLNWLKLLCPRSSCGGRSQAHTEITLEKSTEMRHSMIILMNIPSCVPLKGWIYHLFTGHQSNQKFINWNCETRDGVEKVVSFYSIHLLYLSYTYIIG